MELLIIYLLKVNAVISILFFSYFIFLRNENFFKINRVFLMTCIVFSFTLPLARTIDFFSIAQIQNHVTSTSPFAKAYSGIIKSEKPFTTFYHEIAAYHTPAFGITCIQIVFLGYTLVTLILLLRFSFQLFNLYPIIKQSKKHLRDGIIYCEHDRDIAPFSFFRYLVINRSAYDHDQSIQITAHEIIHIRQWHTIDILFSELAQIILWMNPLVTILKRYIKLNLEYIADEGILNKGADKKSYQLNILQASLNSMSYPLTNLFNSSKLKLRIKMMNSKKAPIRNLYKYVFVLPLILATYFIINPLSVQTLRAQAQKQIQPQQIDSIIARCADAEGGWDKINALRTIHIENTLTLANGISGSSNYDIVCGEKYKRETTIGGQKVLTCVSDTKGWKMDSKDQVGTELTRDEIALYRADIYPGGYLFNYAALGNRIELIGQDELMGVRVYHVEVSTKDGLHISYFINSNSYQVVKEVREDKLHGGTKKRVFEYSKFNKTDEGFIMPFCTTFTNPQGSALIFTINKVIINKDADPKIFVMPK